MTCYIYIFLCEKKETCWMPFAVNNIDISIAAIYDIFDIRESAEFKGGRSFFILLKIVFLFVICYS